jgi:hypothetical protein
MGASVILQVLCKCCVAVKAKPECCSEQNRNPEKRLVERASVHDFALKTTIVEG